MISGKTIKNVPIHINDSLVLYRFVEDGKHYIIDKGYNKIEVDEPTFLKIKAPIRKRASKDEVQPTTSGK